MSSSSSTSKDMWPCRHVPRRRRDEIVLLREAVDIAVQYFNYGTREETKQLTRKAKSWSERYYKKRYNRYGQKRAVGLIRDFPSLFNLSVSPSDRLAKAVMVTPKPDGDSAKSEKFPEWVEPTLASDEEIDEIVDLRPRQPRGKPKMRVNAAQLRDSGLLKSLPEFINQLAQANLETETRLANSTKQGAGFELDEDEAATQPHIEMNLLAGLLEKREVGGLEKLKMPGQESSASSSSSSSTETSDSDVNSPASASEKPSQKRKADSRSDSESSSSTRNSGSPSATKIRIVTKKRARSSAVSISPPRPAPSSESNSDDSSASPSTTSSGDESKAGVKSEGPSPTRIKIKVVNWQSFGN